MAIKESNTDVLIIGAGPSGYMCATWLARCGIPFRIIDKRSNEVFAGQADGLQSRTLEIFKSFSDRSFDFATLDQGWKVANHVTEMCFWSPDESGKIVRNSRVPDSAPGISNYTECVIHQGNVEKWFNESIENFSSGKVKVERPLLPVSMTIKDDADPQSYAVDVMVKKLSSDLARPKQEGKVANGLFRAFDGDQDAIYNSINKDNEDDYELIHAKYVVGSDGAHSWVRKQLGIDMDGEHTDFVWGVLDITPITNFPDIRNRCAIHSKDSGSIMVIPRENDLVRFYIQLNEVERDPETKGQSNEFSGTVAERKASKGRIDRSKITPESILKQAQEIFKPYTLEMTDLRWYTGYQIGQRVSPSFGAKNRVFISGDACHTHSPKAGQGMNVSMQDTYNLGFKLALVCKGLANQDILTTYESERLKVARDLIAYDHKLSRLFSGKPMIPNSDVFEGGVSMDEFQTVYHEGAEFASGTIVDYQDSILISKKGASQDPNDVSGKEYHPLASKVPVGRRLMNGQIIAQADGRPVDTLERFASDGRFRVLLFAGDIKGSPKNMDVLCDFQELLDSNDFFAKKYTPVNAFENSVIDVVTIHSSDRHNVELEDFPAFTHPLDYKRRCDYWRLYTGVGETYHEGSIDAYDAYGIDKTKGAIIVLRPDSHVAVVTDFSVAGLKEVDNYFGKFMIPQTKNVLPPKDPQANDTDRFVLPKLAV
ncbi:Phenol 2-monooxygenase [Candida viswanathii]|uniref:Phenol 2-monooxygenase n=1 Tax=Candida viswanathii TaxID=5486 RepID=A0A367Y1I9_9ASCO|nr:Phenol 2-monooxygenase [Candida viswanathii]